MQARKSEDGSAAANYLHRTARSQRRVWRYSRRSHPALHHHSQARLPGGKTLDKLPEATMKFCNTLKMILRPHTLPTTKKR